jgi:hypothetical protein
LSCRRDRTPQEGTAPLIIGASKTLIQSLLISAALRLGAGASGPEADVRAQRPPGAEEWQIGPIIRSRNYSVGMPLTPTPSGRGWYVDFPHPDRNAGHVHYISFVHGPLTGKRRIVMRYRIEAEPGVRFVPQETPELPATISLVFQRRGDTWSGRGRFEHHRWYVPARAVAEIRPGEHEMAVDLDEDWTSVQGRPASANAAAFRQAIADTERVGIVLGSSSARGHGVYATGPARLTVISFQVI